MGISSNSRRAPLKTGHFEVTDKSFEEASTYSDWQFTFLPAMARRRTPPRPRRRVARAPTRPRSSRLPVCLPTSSSARGWLSPRASRR
jgi:hypothetical protein